MQFISMAACSKLQSFIAAFHWKLFYFQNDDKTSSDQTSEIENYSNIDIQSSKLIQCKYRITHNITHHHKLRCHVRYFWVVCYSTCFYTHTKRCWVGSCMYIYLRVGGSWNLMNTSNRPLMTITGQFIISSILLAQRLWFVKGIYRKARCSFYLVDWWPFMSGFF